MGEGDGEQAMKRLSKLNSEDGFTMVEVIMTVAVVAITMTVLLLVVTATNKVDTFSKENKLTENLIEPYLSYYKNADVTKDNLNIYLSDLGDVDLAKFARQQAAKGATDIPTMNKMYRDLHLVCSNTPSLLKDSEGNDSYLEFNIHCEKNGNKINRGKPFIIKKYIN